MNSATAVRSTVPRTTLSRIIWPVVWAGLGIYLALTLWLGLSGLFYPYQLDYGEGIVLWFARQLAAGHSIYKGLEGLPYASSNYPPVAMLLAAALMPILGYGYVAGRLLNFTSALVVAGLIYRMVRVETRARRLGLLAALFFLGSPYIYHWAALFRVDLIGLAFTFGGLACIWHWQRSRSVQPGTAGVPARVRPWDDAWPLAAAGLLFLLALYTKHTLLAAPAATFLTLLRYNRRLAVAFLLALGAAGGLIYLAINAGTGGAFTFGLITSNATVFLVSQLGSLLENWLVTFPVLIMFAVWGFGNRIRARQVGVLEWYAVISAGMLVLAGRMGAWENYFFEVTGALCVLALASLPRLLENLSSVTRHASLVLGVLLLVQLALMWDDHDPRIAANLMATDGPANQALALLLQQTSGIILSEDMGALVTSGKAVNYYTFQYSSLAQSGQWDQSWELNGLRDGAFPLVILEQGTREDVDRYRRFTREFVSALDRYYARTDEIGRYQIYRPAAPLRILSADFGGEVALVGWSVGPAPLQTGVLRVTLVWRAMRTINSAYTAFVHLEMAGGEKVTQDDHPPHRGFYPTNRWAPGEMVREVYSLELPPGLPAGRYILRTGWYDPESGDRLPVASSPDASVILGPVDLGEVK